MEFVTADLIQQYRENTERARRVAAGLSDAQFLERPDPGRWSIGECIQHLTITNELLIEHIAPALDRTRAKGWTSPDPFRPSWLMSKFIKSLEPPVTMKAKAPDKMRPLPDLTRKECLAEWDQQRAQLEKLLRLSEGLDLTRVSVPSPVTSWVKYSLGSSFLVIAAHDRRHLWQAEQVREQLPVPQLKS
jgi:hypothetical protein